MAVDIVIRTTEAPASFARSGSVNASQALLPASYVQKNRRALGDKAEYPNDFASEHGRTSNWSVLWHIIFGNGQSGCITLVTGKWDTGQVSHVGLTVEIAEGKVFNYFA